MLFRSGEDSSVQDESYAGSESESTKVPNLEVLLEQLLTEGPLRNDGVPYTSFSDKLGEYMDEDMVSGKYGELGEMPDFGMFESYICYFTENYDDEAAVFKLKNAADAETVKRFLRARVERLKKNAVNYPALDVGKINGALISSEGVYVYMIISGDNNKAEEIIFESVR